MSFDYGIMAADNAQLRRENDSLRLLSKQLRDALDESTEYAAHAATCRGLACDCGLYRFRGQADTALKAYDDAMAAEGKEKV